MELQLLIWVLVGAGITAGVFLLARAVIEVGAVAYAFIEQNITRKEATQRSAALLAGATLALVAVAIIAGIAILVLFANILSNTFS